MAKATTKIFPFLWYAKEAEAAAKFYASIFPDSRVDRVTVMQSESPSGPPGSVKVVDFTLFGQPFQAMTAGPHHEFNDAISMVVLCDDQAELDRYWTALLEGGGKEQACGWLNDKYGLRWQIVPARIIDGKAVARHIEEDVAAEISRLGFRPGLVAVRVGNDPASEVYVRSKAKKAEELGLRGEQRIFGERRHDHRRFAGAIERGRRHAPTLEPGGVRVDGLLELRGAGVEIVHGDLSVTPTRVATVLRL